MIQIKVNTFRLLPFWEENCETETDLRWRLFYEITIFYERKWRNPTHTQGKDLLLSRVGMSFVCMKKRGTSK